MKIIIRLSTFSIVIIFLILLTPNLLSQVSASIGTEIIPTYKIGKEEVSPIFYNGRGVQGAQGKVYPYPSQAKLGSELSDESYQMIYLENEYLKVKILPQFGGRLFSAIDKTNGHELFHTNSVIKPDLIGTLGAWVSGGIEWCFPHHHRTATMLPSDYRIVENKDGSITVWIGETERTIRARGVVGMTLHPGKSYIEVDYRINNTSTQTETFLFWANVAVTADENFRTFWPPSQEIGVFHNNNSFIKWPISNQTDDYGRTSYEEGVDLTWWKNHPNPVSFFMWDIKEGFIGGYDYKEKAGMVHVGDPYENKASKLWQFGPGTQGQNARRKLTDDGKAYVELMTGTFSNNQPDYSWILPHSVKDAKNYWYPLRDIEIAKNSTINASVTMQMRDSRKVFYGFNTTQEYKSATVHLTYGDKVLISKRIDIDPASPFTETFTANEDIEELELNIALVDRFGNILVSYKPHEPTNPVLPKKQERVKSPNQIESVEDLYLTGRFVEQFKRPGKDPSDYYLAAIDKSPTDYRANIAMGIYRLSQMKYKEALSYLQVAADKLNVKYYQPKEGELFYYMGLAQKGLGLTDEAYLNFAQAAWYYSWFSASNFQLAQIESTRHNYKKALDYIKEAYSTNTRDGRIVVLYSALLRKLGMSQEAKSIVSAFLDYDPLNFAALYEQHQLMNEGGFEKWHSNMQDVDNNYLEISTNYLNAGLAEEGINLLSNLESPSNPLIPYYLSWFYNQAGNFKMSKDIIQTAKNLSLDYCFPYREETEIVLNYVIEQDPKNSAAYYLLGNLLYDNRPEDAMSSWKAATELDDNIPMVWRNLAFGNFYNKGESNKAISAINKAIELDPAQSMWYAELSKYYDESDLDFTECLNTLRDNLAIVKQDVSAPKKYVELLNLNGDYDEAIDFLDTHHFRTWEGGREIYWHYVNSHTLKAISEMENGNYKVAINHLERALEYPENLEVGKPTHDEKNAMIYYYMGQALAKLGNKTGAKEYYQKSVNSKNGRNMYELLFYQGKSYEALGNQKKANELHQELIDRAQMMRKGDSEGTLIAVEEASSGKNNKQRSMSYYLEALGNHGLGKAQISKELLRKSLEAYSRNLWATVMDEEFE